MTGIGKGCLDLFVLCIIVIAAITKVIVGGEYVGSCPYNQTIPLYVIISGCLPVFLSALRQPALKKCQETSWKIWVFASSAVLINIIWLVIGTVMVANAWKHINGNVGNCTNGVTDFNSTFDPTPEMYNNSFNNLSANSNNEKRIYEFSENTTYDENKNAINHSSVEKATVSIDRNDVTSMCPRCSGVIMKFSLAVVCIDWTVFLLSIVYLFTFGSNRLLQFKEIICNENT